MISTFMKLYHTKVINLEPSKQNKALNLAEQLVNNIPKEKVGYHIQVLTAVCYCFEVAFCKRK